MSQSALARAVGVSQEAVWQWENAATNPTASNVAKIAKAIGVSLQVFYGEPPASLPRSRPTRKGAA